MAIASPAREPQAPVTQGQAASPKEPFGRPVVSFDASRGRRTRSGASGGIANLFRRLLGGREG